MCYDAVIMILLTFSSIKMEHFMINLILITDHGRTCNSII
jgi:hypothetical protein